MNRTIAAAAALLALSLASQPAAAQVTLPPGAARDAVVARAKTLELNTPYEPVPGTAVEYQAVGYATVLCTAMFISGLDWAFARENTGYFTAPYEARSTYPRIRINRE